jgi:NAD(P)-dependent dehydrogenase (short-subunit alcohol dehydrogenase family)
VTQRTALITGGGSGMGKATSVRLAREGTAVGVLDINRETAEAVARAIRDAGGRAIALCADIADRRQVEAAVSELRGAFGAIGILINNAAVENFCAFAEIRDENWDKLIDTNLKGAFIVTQAVLPDMLAMRWGRIVNVSALGAQSGAPNMAHYTASKGGLIALTRSLAIELGPKGITVNSVSPGFIDTPMSRRAIDGGLFPVPYEQIIATYPIPRLGQPDDIACACAFFASEETGYITAQVLGVNGGAAV